MRKWQLNFVNGDSVLFFSEGKEPSSSYCFSLSEQKVLNGIFKDVSGKILLHRSQMKR